jgi:hypothetical protein
LFHNSSRTSDFQSYTWGPDLGFDRSNTLVNRPQIFVANAIYYLPSLKGSNSFVQATVGGWELAVISQYSSGASSTLYQYWFTDLANGNTVGLIGTGNPQARPLATAIPSKGVGGPEVLNPDSVSVIGYQIGTIPNGIEPHGYCRRPGYVNTDFSVDKNWRMWHEKLRLQFRLDFFNFFNHPNFRGDFINGRRVYRSSMSDRRTSGPCLGRRSRASLPRIATGGFEDGVAWIEQLRTARNVFS